ncbi:hypothetical protein PBY51_016906 [Eleginops maclovinus]|uniref:Uncharacterized protein n=1 Tax=Eleginops maclovinus TaxID=56733 RepID=A0AAN7WR50_ELEMC|nr:hypothetical protein PBY51_016906 [Eleginops maclovinus]
MKLQRKLVLSVGEKQQSGRVGGEAGGQGPLSPWFEHRGTPMEESLHLKTSAAPLCSLSPGSRASTARPRCTTAGLARRKVSTTPGDFVTTLDLLPSPFSCCTTTHPPLLPVTLSYVVSLLV